MRHAVGLLSVFGLAMLLAEGAFSETQRRGAPPGTGSAILEDPADPAADSPAAPFGALSSANQKIAQALYRAQQVSTAGYGSEPAAGPLREGAAHAVRPWSLDRIAAEKARGRGWGDVFRQMQADHVIDGASLAQIIGQEWVREFREEKDPSAASATSFSDVLVTYTNNRSSVVVTRGHPSYTAIRSKMDAAGIVVTPRADGHEGTGR